MVNLYKNGGSYKAHQDMAVMSSVTFFDVGSYTGGEFCFPDYDVRVESKDNWVIIFAGCIKHMAEPIVAEDGNYRVSIANFMNYK